MEKFGEISLGAAIALDGFTIVCCALLARKIARSPLHPAWTFLAVHCYIVTFRLFQLSHGGSPMMSYFSWPVALTEVTRAAVASDLGLASMTLGWIVASFHKTKFYPKGKPIQVSTLRVRLAIGVALIMGTVGIVFAGRTSGGETQSVSGFIASAVSWPSWAMALLVYAKGFRARYLVISALVFGIVALASLARSAMIIPVIFLVTLWLSNRNSRRIPLRVVVVLLGLVAIWLPLKTETGMLVSGASVGQAASAGVEKLATSLSGRDVGGTADNVDTEFLDMIGSTMTLVDVRGHWYWGTTITPFFVAIVPRELWPGKPKPNQYQLELDIPERTMFLHSGMTAGLVGEAYANLGWAGILITCFLVGTFFAGLFYAKTSQESNSPFVLIYLVFLSTSMQLCRDGFVSAVWFPFVYAAPITFMALSHWIVRPRSTSRRQRAPQSDRANLAFHPSGGKSAIVGALESRRKG